MQAREPELGVVSKPDANVPLDADGVFALRERIHLQREIREQVREGEAAEDAGPDEGRVELQRVDESLLPPAHRRRAEEKVLVDAVVGEEGRSADGVARVERGVQPLDRLPRAQNLITLLSFQSGQICDIAFPCHNRIENI